MVDNKYLTLNYLIKYGYFDIKNNKTKKNLFYDDNKEYQSSSTIYKGIFNCDELYKNLPCILKKFDDSFYEETEPIQFSVYKNDEERRIYKYPNIYSYICLSKHLEENNNYYDQILKSKQSLSNKFYDRTFLEGKIKRYRNRLGKRYIFKTDIENFYPSIYTHSIPWILAGKSEAKKNKNDKKIYYNQLDSLIQRCQYGETHGIPVGTFASRIIAEIYMCKIDESLNQYNYVRYVDDFELAYNSKEEQIEFYNMLYKELKNVNLKIKREKNVTESFPFSVEEDIDCIFTFIIDKIEKLDINNKSLISKQRRILYRLIDFCILKEKQGKKGSLKLLFKSLKQAYINNQVDNNAWKCKIWEGLINIVLMRPQLSNYFLELVDVIDDEELLKYIRNVLDDISGEIQDNIHRYVDLEYNEEICSILSICYSLEQWSIVDQDCLLECIGRLDDFNAILAMEMYIKNENIEWKNLFDILERKLENSFEWKNEFWLFKYQLFYKIAKEKGKKFEKEYKDFIYNKYSNGKNKGQFFDKKNIKKIYSPIILDVQNKNGNKLTQFYKNMYDKNITFFMYK